MTNAVALAIKVTSDARAAAAGIDSATGKVSKLGRAGQVAGRLLAAGLLIAAGAALKFTNAAADDAQAAAQLAQTAKQAAGATAGQTKAMEDWIAAQGRAKGVADDELRPAMSKLITATGSITKAQKLASLAMDISTRSGKSLDSVSQALAKAQTGSVGGLGKYGVATKDAAGHTKTLAAIQKDLANTYKGAAAAGADTAAGKAKILAVQMDELQEKIGTGLLPVMGKLVGIGLKVVDWISKNLAVVGALLGALGTFLAIIKAVTVAQAVYNAVLALNPLVLVVAALVALGVAFVIAYKKSQTFREIVDAAFAGISKVVAGVVDFIRDHWKALLIILGGPIGLAVVLIVSHFDKIKAVVGAVVDWVKDHWPTIKLILVTAFTEAKDRISTIIDAVTTVIKAVKSTIETVAEGVKAAVQGIIDKFQAAIDKVQALIDKINSIPGGGAHGRTGQLGQNTPPTGGGQPQPADRFAPRGAARGDTHIHLHGFAFVGNERQLATEIDRLLGANRRRYNGPEAA